MSVVGASEEVIRHHVDVHPCGKQNYREVVCPCARCIALACEVCDTPVFLAVSPNEDPCEHALELLEGEQ